MFVQDEACIGYFGIRDIGPFIEGIPYDESNDPQRKGGGRTIVCPR